MNAGLERELQRLGAAGEKALALVRQTGSIRDAPEVPEELRDRFPVALEIEPKLHLRMQAAFQQHVDAAVSKTVNLPADATPETVREIFLLAHELKLKGVTVYRYGSKPVRVLSIVEDSAAPDCRECSV